MDVFSRDRGLYQQRIAKPNAPEGQFVYELGHSRLQDYGVSYQDGHRVTQSFMRDPDTKYVRATITVVTPPNLPNDSYWLVSGFVNDELMVSRKLRLSKRVITLDDWRLRVADTPPPPTPTKITFQLQLVPMFEVEEPT